VNGVAIRKGGAQFRSRRAILSGRGTDHGNSVNRWGAVGTMRTQKVERQKKISAVWGDILQNHQGDGACLIRAFKAAAYLVSGSDNNQGSQGQGKQMNRLAGYGKRGEENINRGGFADPDNGGNCGSNAVGFG